MSKETTLTEHDSSRFRVRAAQGVTRSAAAQAWSEIDAAAGRIRDLASMLGEAFMAYSFKHRKRVTEEENREHLLLVVLIDRLDDDSKWLYKHTEALGTALKGGEAGVEGDRIARARTVEHDRS